MGRMNGDAVKSPMKRRVTVVGYAGESIKRDKTDTFSVRETLNYPDLMPGETVKRSDLHDLIERGVEVVATRRK